MGCADVLSVPEVIAVADQAFNQQSLADAKRVVQRAMEHENDGRELIYGEVCPCGFACPFKTNISSLGPSPCIQKRQHGHPQYIIYNVL